MGARGPYFHYGRLVGSFPVFFFLVPLFLPFCLVPFVFPIPLSIDLIGLFGPHRSETPEESRLLHQFNRLTTARWPELLQDASVGVNISEKYERVFREAAATPQANVVHYISGAKDLFIVGTPETNIMSKENLKLMQDLDDEFRTNYTFMFQGRNFNYSYFCSAHNQCEVITQNPWLRAIEFLSHEKEFIQNDHLEFNYPIYNFMVGNALFGVHVEGGFIENATIGFLRFHFSLPADDYEACNAFEEHLRDFFHEKFQQTELSAVVVDMNSINNQMISILIYAMPYIATCIAVLIVYLVISNWRHSTVFECLMGLTSVVLSIITTYTLLFVLRCEFSPMVIISPFLALAIGIDDTFLIIEAWKWSDDMDSRRERLGATMSATGMAITLTTTTDVVSFLFGYFYCPSKGLVQICLYTMVAMIVDFIYQITFFPASIYLLDAYRKRTRIKHVKLDKQIQYKKKGNFISDNFIPFLLSSYSKIGVAVLYLCYAYFALLGVSRMPINMTLDKLVLDHSPYKPWFPLMENHVWTDYFEITVQIRQPPDFRNVSELNKFIAFVEQFEDVKRSAGAGATQLWLREYIPVLNFLGEGPEYHEDWLPEFYEPSTLREFFLENAEFQTRVRFNYSADVAADPPSLLHRFTFVLPFLRNPTWSARREIIYICRALCRTYPEYAATPFTHLAPYVDMETVLIPSVLQALGLALIAVGLVTFVLLGSEFARLPWRRCLAATTRTIFVVAATVLSIQAGVIGILYYWGVEYDIISSVFLLMTVGFAVDSTAHIALKYEHTDESSPCQQRCAETLLHVGWPILQAGMSTCLCISVAFLIPCYFTSCFAKCVIVAVGLGIAHGFVLLPILYSLLAFPSSKTLRQRRLEYETALKMR